MRLFTHHDRLYLTTPSKAAVAEDGEGRGGHAAVGGFFVPHFHKFFGLLALVNIILLVLFYDWAVAHIGTKKLMLLSCSHVVLALSSFEFRIGRARNGLYTIYREMQLHTIGFTMRSFCVLVGAWVFGVENILVRASYVLVWHVVADLVTAKFQPPSKETTIRRSVNGEVGYKEHGKVVHFALFIFSFTQLVGIFLMITDTTNAARNAMFAMGPVQISAFLATLVRKGYCSSRTSFVAYFMALMPVFIFHHYTPIEVATLATVAFARFKLRMNKYVIWITVTLLFAWMKGDLQALVGPAVEAFAPPAVPKVAFEPLIAVDSTVGSALLRGAQVSMFGIGGF